jgi:prepilin-type N-terminal cleavage/methylation domain-containing protein
MSGLGRGRRAGFTLPELVVVIGIGALVAAISFPEMARMLRKARTEEAAGQLESILRLSREKALAKRTCYRLTFDPTARTYVVEFEETPGVWSADFGTPRTMPDGVGFVTDINGTGGASTVADLLIEARGTVSIDDAPAEFFVYNDRGDTLGIEMVRTGRVRSWHL